MLCALCFVCDLCFVLRVLCLVLCVRVRFVCALCVLCALFVCALCVLAYYLCVRALYCAFALCVRFVCDGGEWVSLCVRERACGSVDVDVRECACSCIFGENDVDRQGVRISSLVCFYLRPRLLYLTS